MEALAAFIDLYAALDEKDRATLRGTLSSYEAMSVASLSGAAAERALNDRDAKWLWYGLFAHDLEQFRRDPRENARLLSMIHHAACRLGEDPAAMFQSVAAEVSEPTAEQLTAFIRRPDFAKKLMGLQEVATPAGIRFAPVSGGGRR